MIWVVALASAAGVLTWPTAGHPDDPPRSMVRDGAGARAATATPYAVADALVLLALAVRSGDAPVEALEDVASRVQGPVAAHLRSVAAAHRWGVEPRDCWQQVPAVWHPAAMAWAAALTAGVSPARLLERAAAVVREREARRIEAALAKAGVLLVLPLGLAFLPGFVATTVIPVVARLLADRL